MRTFLKVIYWIFFAFVIMLSFAMLVSYSTIHHHNWQYMEEGMYHWEVCSSCLETTPRHITITTTTKEATCIDNGTVKYHCKECAFVREDWLPMKDEHDFEETIVTEPTCLNKGTKNYTCKTCGHSENETLDKLTVHTYVDGVCEVCGIPQTYGLEYTLNSDGTYSVASVGFATDSVIYIPKEHNGVAVTAIKNRAFYGCKTITAVIIPDCITSVGSDAFNGCVALTEIYCKADSKPSGWSKYWNYNCNATIYWG